MNKSPIKKKKKKKLLAKKLERLRNQKNRKLFRRVMKK